MDPVFQSDYYRMTGTKYRFGLRAMVQFIAGYRIRYVYWLRKAERKPSIICRLMLRGYARKYGLEISPNARIGAGLYRGHPYGITVADGVRLGDNVNLHKGCTIGRENRGRREGVPVIGSRVSVGINATVVGNIHIGDDVMIAPGAFVNFDVPSHCVVLGNPGVIHPKENATQGYVGFCV